jgi:NADH:ubiquinone reductase (H+-translocating)
VGFKTIAEALYLRDHLLEQLELADATDDPAMRRARCTFVVVVGAGYNRDRARGAGAAVDPGRAPSQPRISAQTTCAGSWSTWRPTIPAELGEQLSRPALRILRGRGVDVRLRTTVEEVTAGAVRLSDGTTVPTRTLVWCVGVTLGRLPKPLDSRPRRVPLYVKQPAVSLVELSTPRSGHG